MENKKTNKVKNIILPIFLILSLALFIPIGSAELSLETISEPLTIGEQEFSLLSNITPKTFFWLLLLVSLTLLIPVKNILILKGLLIMALTFLTFNMLNETPKELQGLEFLLIISFIYIIYLFYAIIQTE